MMQFLREMFWLSARHNFRLTSEYIPSRANTLSDSLSRGDFDKFNLRALDPEELTVCLYVTQLASTCSYRSIKQYLNGVRVLGLSWTGRSPQSHATLRNLVRNLSRLSATLLCNVAQLY
jgi:hypothetical protein